MGVDCKVEEHELDGFAIEEKQPNQLFCKGKMHERRWQT
jgi:hypothetical protein